MNARPWSYSRMKVARACPYLFKRQYVDGVEQPTNPPLRVGQVAHEVIARYGLHCTAAGRQTDYEAMDRIISDCRNMLITAEEKESVRYMCTRFAESRLIDPGWHYEGRYAVDADWKPCPYDSDTAYFRGRIDCWYVDGEDNLVIVDYYTGRKRPDEFLKKDQLMHYAAVLFAAHPDIDNAVCFADFLRFGDASVEFSVTRDHVQHIRAEIESLDSRYAQEREFKPSPNENCQYCFLKRECPAVIDAIKNIFNPELDARRVYLLRCAYSDGMKRLAKEPGGAWAVNDMTLGHHQTSEEKYRLETVIEILTRKLKGNMKELEVVLNALYSVVDHIPITKMKGLIVAVNKLNALPKKLSLEDFKDARFYKSGTTFTFKAEKDANPEPDF